MAQQPNRLVSINADVVGYSRLLADDFDATSERVAEYRHLVEAIITADGGELAQFVGDNFMALFRDATQALHAAIAITTEVETVNLDVPANRQVVFRMGLDVGDVTLIDGNHHGDALNIAARIQSIARPGGISVSGRVYRELDEPALRFRSLGPRTMKNIPEPVEVYELADLPTIGGHATDRPSLSLESVTIAVLPIQFDDADDRIRPIASVVRGDLLHRLAAMPDLTVMDLRLDDAGSPSGAGRYMLETGIHRIGEAVRVFATLYDITTMNVVKSLKWTSTIDGVFALVDRIADETAHAVEVELVVGAPAGLYAELEDPTAIEDVYLGWYHLRTDTPDGWRQAVDHFGNVARAHPESPFGHVLSAFATWIGASNGWTTDPEKALEDAWAQAQRGIDAGDPTGMGMTVHAAIKMTRGDVDGALIAMDSVEIIRPTCDVTYGLEGSVRRYLGQWEKAVDLMDVAMRLTGVNKPWYPTVKASSLLMGGRTQQAADLAEAVLEHQPNNLEALMVLTTAQVELGLDRRARATAALIKQRFPSVDIAEWLDRNPYQDAGLVERWKRDLTAAGAI